MDTSATELALRLLEQREWLRELARQLVGAAEADDLAQETWLHALRRPVQGVLDTRAWLSAIARNLARGKDRSRRHARSREEIAARSEALPSTAELIERVDTERALARALVELREPYRTTLLLRFHEGLSAEEIARREGISAGTVRWRTNQGLAELRQRLERDFGGRAALGAALVALLPEGARAPAGTTGIGAGGLLMGVGLKTVAATIAGSAVLVLGIAYAPWRGAQGGALRSVAAVDRAPLAPSGEASSVSAPVLANELSRRAPATIGTTLASGAGPARIHVLESDGSAHANKLVLLLANADEAAASASTDESGWLELAPSPEPRAAVIERANALPYRTSIERSAGEHELRMSEGAVLEGRFVVQGPAPRRPIAFDVFPARSAGEITDPSRDGPEAALQVALAQVTTDGDGRFLVRGLESERSYNLRLRGGYVRPEWLSTTGEMLGSFGGTVFHVAHPARGLVFELVRLSSVFGRLVDSSGRPTSGVIEGRFRWTNGTSTDLSETVGTDGLFELFPGKSWRSLDLDYWGTPGMRGDASATFEATKIGFEGDLGELRLVAGHSLRLHVVDEEGRPIAGARTWPEGGPTDERGEAPLSELTAESLQVAARGYHDARVAVPSEGSSLEVVLARGPLLSLVVRAADGEAPGELGVELEAAEPCFDGEFGPSSLLSRDREGHFRSSGGHPFVARFVTSLEGRLSLDSLRAGAAGTLRVIGPSGVVHEELVAPLGPEEWRTLSIALEQRALRVRGRVVDEQGNPVPAACVSLPPPRAGGRAQWIEPHSNGDGRFETVLLPDPGASLTITKEGYRPSTCALADFDGAEPTVVLRRGLDLVVRVVDELGRTRSGGRLWMGESDELPDLSTSVEERLGAGPGRWELHGLGDGPVALVLRIGGATDSRTELAGTEIEWRVPVMGAARVRWDVEGAHEVLRGMRVELRSARADVGGLGRSFFGVAQGEQLFDPVLPGTYEAVVVLDTDEGKRILARGALEVVARATASVALESR